MLLAYVVVAVLFAAMVAMSGVAKLRQNERIVAGIHGVVGVPMSWFPVLAAAELAGAVGLLAGIALPALGIAAATGLVLYFVGAVIGHVRVGDLKGVPNAVMMLVPAVGVLALCLLSA
jgi:hypothetical protein